MRFAMTAKTVLNQRESDNGLTDLTTRNIIKVTRFRPKGAEELQKMVSKMERLQLKAEKRKEYQEGVGKKSDKSSDVPALA
jgi:large subunit ribosomal protein L17